MSVKHERGPVQAPHAAGLLYLLLPVLLFWWAYVGGVAGGLFGAVALGATLGVLRAAPRTAILTPANSAGWPRWAAALMLATGVLWLTGFPGGPYPWDWFKHWALIDLLAQQPWPVRTELQGQTLGLRFYLAAYLVPAALAKAPLALPTVAGTALWLGLGVALLLRAVATGTPGTPRAGLAMVVFLLMAGADSAAEYTLRALAGLPQSPWFGFHHEWWALDWLGQPFQYSSVLTALSWVPHQSIATLMVALMLAEESEQPPWAGALGLGLLALWSPFGLLGLLPLLVWRLVRSRRAWLGDPRQAGALLALAAATVPLVLATARYLASELPATGFSWPSAAMLAARLSTGLLFCAVELLPFVLILGWHRLREPAVAVSLVTLLLLPCLGGEPPDFLMRASLGPLGVLAWRAAQVLAAAPGSDARRAPASGRAVSNGLAASVAVARWAGMAGLLLASLTSINEAVYQRQAGAAHAGQAESDALHKPYLLGFAYESQISVKEFFDTCGWGFLPQYFAQHPAWIAEPR